jgi:hypothetical protein
VVLHLDNRSLALTESCKAALEKLRKFKDVIDKKAEKAEEALVQFYQDFGLSHFFKFSSAFLDELLTCMTGHFFATNVELGGKLFATEQFTSTDKSNASEKANAMKISASLSFSFSSIQASASYNKETQDVTRTTSESSRMDRALSWEAVGGDTTLCNK